MMKDFFIFLLRCEKNFWFLFFRLFPIHNNKIVATTMRGRKYGDNPRCIVEYVKNLYPEVNVVWLTDKDYKCDIPQWVRTTPYRLKIKTIYELTTAKVWIDTHRLRSIVVKREGQCFIETWHGGLGIKKIEGDIQRVLDTPWEVAEIKNTSKLADVFISNSDHLSSIYRRAFGYEGPIWKCGYPKNDIMLQYHNHISENVKKELNIGLEKKIILYAPTYRDRFAWGNNPDFSVYDINYKWVKESVKEHFGGDWIFLVKWHPTMIPYIQRNLIHFENVIDVTTYNDMQGLLCASDIMISDYSSCIFDAALREIPCFTFAKDFDEYKSVQGTYFDMEELPFPYARNNDELISNILTYNHDDYIERWKQFTVRTGLHETGHATEDIANKITDILKGKRVVWE